MHRTHRQAPIHLRLARSSASPHSGGSNEDPCAERAQGTYCWVEDLVAGCSMSPPLANKHSWEILTVTLTASSSTLESSYGGGTGTGIAVQGWAAGFQSSRGLEEQLDSFFFCICTLSSENRSQTNGCYCDIPPQAQRTRSHEGHEGGRLPNSRYPQTRGEGTHCKGETRAVPTEQPSAGGGRRNSADMPCNAQSRHLPRLRISFHELTTFVPTPVSYAIPASDKPAKLSRPPNEVFYFSEDQYKSGIEHCESKTDDIRIYGPEKTVCDLFRFRNRLSEDLPLEGLKEYLKRRNRDLHKLLKYAEVCRVKAIVSQYVKAIVG